MFAALIIMLLWFGLGSLLYIIIRNKKIGLSYRQTLVFFGCKIAGGAMYGYIFKRYYNGDDTWGLNHDGFLQYQRLLHSPFQFFSDIVSPNPIPPDDIYYFHPYGYLENLEYSIVTKMIAFFNFVGQGNYYINIVFFNFLSFWGVYLIYKLVAAQLPPGARPMAAAVLFLFPPAVFWLSGIRAEGLLILFTGILFYQFDQWIKYRKISSILYCLAGFIMDLILRNGFAALLIPALAAWWLKDYYKMSIKKAFAMVYIIVVAAVGLGSFVLPPQWNGLAYISDRQHDFFTLKGNTRFNLTALDDRPYGFIKILPEALLNTFVRPFPTEAKGLLQWFTAAENISVLLFTCITIVLSRRNMQTWNTALIWLFIACGVGNYIVIGYIVPFPGAIVRYKIIPELLLICACVIVLGNAAREKNYSTTALRHI